MSNFGPPPGYQRSRPIDYGTQAGSPALISFFNAVYAWMACGLALTAVVAWWVSLHDAVMRPVFSGGVLILLIVAQLVLVATISMAVRKINATAATALFLLYAGLNGLTLSAIFLVYTMASIVGAFAACAVMFGVMSVYGMLTKSDLTGLGKLAFMGLIGIIVASLVNLFLHSNGFSWIISYVGVAVFVGLTAYDTQRLKEIALNTSGDLAMASRMAISGALMLYLDFLNMSLFLLRIMGDRR